MTASPAKGGHPHPVNRRRHNFCETPGGTGHEVGKILAQSANTSPRPDPTTHKHFNLLLLYESGFLARMLRELIGIFSLLDFHRGAEHEQLGLG